MCDFTVCSKLIAFLSLISGISLTIGCFIIFAWEEQFQNEIQDEIEQLNNSSLQLPQIILKAPSIQIPDLPSLKLPTFDQIPNNSKEASNDYSLESVETRFKRSPYQNPKENNYLKDVENSRIIFREETTKYFNSDEIIELDEDRLSPESSSPRSTQIPLVKKNKPQSTERTQSPIIFWEFELTTPDTTNAEETTTIRTSTELQLTTELAVSSYDLFLNSQEIESLKKLFGLSSSSASASTTTAANVNSEAPILFPVETVTSTTPKDSSVNNKDVITFEESTAETIISPVTNKYQGEEATIIFREEEEEETTTPDQMPSRISETTEFPPVDVRSSIPDYTTEEISSTEKVNAVNNKINKENKSVVQKPVKKGIPIVSPQVLQKDWKEEIQPTLFGVTGASAGCGVLMVLVSSLILCFSDKACRKYLRYWLACHVLMGLIIIICMVIMVALCERLEKEMLPTESQRSQMEARLLKIVDNAKFICTLFYMVDGAGLGVITILVLITFTLITFCGQMDMYGTIKERKKLLKEQALINERFY